MRLELILIAGCAAGAPPAPVPAPSNRMEITVLDTVPADALELDVDAFPWRCTIKMTDGTTDDVLRVPTGRAIKLVLTTRAQFHDAGIEVSLVGTPAKRAVRWGKPQLLVFRIDRPGTYGWICPTIQPPGAAPADPTLPLHAETPEAYASYAAALRESTNPTSREGKLALGKKLVEKKGCIACHTIDGTPKIGVSLAGLWGQTVELVDGTTHVVDANFIVHALTDPQTYRRSGFPPSMPSYEGQLRANEVRALIDYIELLADVKPAS